MADIIKGSGFPWRPNLYLDSTLNYIATMSSQTRTMLTVNKTQKNYAPV
jgi:hypothetical protein